MSSVVMGAFSMLIASNSDLLRLLFHRVAWHIQGFGRCSCAVCVVYGNFDRLDTLRWQAQGAVRECQPDRVSMYIDW